MTWLVALLTLTALPGQPASTAVAAATESVERLPLPALGKHPGVRVRALDSMIVLQAPSTAAPLAGALRHQKRILCPTLEELPGELRLHCTSRFIMAQLVEEGGRPVLEVRQTHALPWEGVDAPPLLPFDPAASGLGDPCPGSTASGRGECRLAQDDRAGARAAFGEVFEGTPRAHADLRLGDLAFAAGDLDGAIALWNEVTRPPYQRLAAARLCELSRSCLEEAHLDALYAGDGLPAPLARDLALRHARTLAFLGRPVEAVRIVLAASYAGSACGAAPALCQRILNAALKDPGPDAAEVLAAWAELPERDKSPDAWETDLLVAELSDRIGAPAYAASVLAASAGRVPPRALGEYLLRTAELYLEAKDPIRAGVILEFAKGRARKKGLAGPRWAAVIRGVAGPATPQKTPPHPPPAAEHQDEALLARAQHAAEAARKVSEGGHP